MLENISLSFYPGAKIGVLGPNGAGKSSLLRIMAGLDDGFSGEARLTPGFTVGYLAQEPQLDPTKDVHGQRDGRRGAGARACSIRYNEVMAMWADPDADYDKIGALQAELEDKIAATDAWSLERNVEIAMDALRCPPDDADVTTLSGGERRRVALCRLLLSAAPTCCCSTSRPTTSTPRASSGSSASCRSTPAPSSPSPTTATSSTTSPSGSSSSTAAAAFPFEGNYSSLARAEAGAPRPRGEAGNEARQRTLAARARVGADGARRRARPRARPASPPTRSCRPRPRPPSGGPDRLEITIPPGQRLGDTVIEVEHLRQGLRRPAAHRGPLVHAAARPASSASSARTAPARRRCSGCSPGRSSPTAATITVGDTVELAYVDQSRDTLDADSTVYEEITGGVEHMKVGNREIHGRAYVASFNFKGSDQQKRVGDLSRRRAQPRAPRQGAERRAATCCSSTSRPNDLDVDTLRALEDALEAFPGCAVVISHDRWFLDRIATHVLAFEGDSQVRWFEGNFSEYEAWRHKELGAEADSPHRIKYKPLAR